MAGYIAYSSFRTHSWSKEPCRLFWNDLNTPRFSFDPLPCDRRM